MMGKGGTLKEMVRKNLNENWQVKNTLLEKKELIEDEYKGDEYGD